MNLVVDASALLAVLLDEPGGEVVIPRLRGAIISTVNVAECFERAVDKGASAQAVRHLLINLEMDIVAFDLTQAASAADLKPLTRHIGASLGDRACLALALCRQTPVLTADRRWSELDIGIDIRLIR